MRQPLCGTLAPSGSHGMLATDFTADGTGIIANDPISGQRVELANDTATRTIGGVTIFDPKAKDWLALSDAVPRSSRGDINLLADHFAALRGFAPGSYYAVTVKSGRAGIKFGSRQMLEMSREIVRKLLI